MLAQLTPQQRSLLQRRHAKHSAADSKQHQQTVKPPELLQTHPAAPAVDQQQRKPATDLPAAVAQQPAVVNSAQPRQTRSQPALPGTADAPAESSSPAARVRFTLQGVPCSLAPVGGEAIEAAVSRDPLRCAGISRVLCERFTATACKPALTTRG